MSLPVFLHFNIFPREKDYIKSYVLRGQRIFRWNWVAVVLGGEVWTTHQNTNLIPLQMLSTESGSSIVSQFVKCGKLNLLCYPNEPRKLN